MIANIVDGDSRRRAGDGRDPFRRRPQAARASLKAVAKTSACPQHRWLIPRLLRRSAHVSGIACQSVRPSDRPPAYTGAGGLAALFDGQLSAALVLEFRSGRDPVGSGARRAFRCAWRCLCRHRQRDRRVGGLPDRGGHCRPGADPGLHLPGHRRGNPHGRSRTDADRCRSGKWRLRCDRAGASARRDWGKGGDAGRAVRYRSRILPAMSRCARRAAPW